HRDVKPGNILIGEGRWALLTDFGLAKIKGGGFKVTQTGVGVGTPDYMSPEQAQGLPVDGRTDLYSLGATMYEMLTGQTPFDGDGGMAILIKHITEPVKPPREINPKIPSAVQEVIMKSLSKDPNQRFQTAESMVAAFARAVGPIGGRAANVAVTISQAEARAQTEAANKLSVAAAPKTSRLVLDRLLSAGRAIFSKVGGTIKSRWRPIGISFSAVVLIALVLASLQRNVADSQTLTPTAHQPNVTVAGGVMPNNVVDAVDSTYVVTSNGASLAGMATVPSGSFTMGAIGSDAQPDETPAHKVTLAGYYIDLREVTNAQFTRFITATNYKTDGERSNDTVTWRTFNTPDRQQFPVV
ncbi:MAG TPA: bifunctional serine/threonine-protein kinase/formylglycine-generating enzyme family protein, partial [Anaerolineae bacterium]|nr:bifunctional serine/threonine-protein kinase/formylglycine-generating enzyme family protein [Anaerolineae bacterium]